MGWEVHPSEYNTGKVVMRDGDRLRVFKPLTDWNDTMLVEAKLREAELWEKYLDRLGWEIGDEWWEQFSESDKIKVLMAATQEQRMRAALEVIGDE